MKDKQNAKNKEKLSKTIEGKLKNSKNIFEANQRLEGYEVFKNIIMAGAKTDTGFGFEFPSRYLVKFSGLIAELIEEGQVEIINDIITNYVGTNFKYTERKLDILHMACMFTNSKIVKLCVDLKLSESTPVSSILDVKCERGFHILEFFFYNSLFLNRAHLKAEILETIKYLCDLGIDLNIKHNNGKSLIHNILKMASLTKNLTDLSREVVRDLVKKGANFKEVPGNMVEKFFADLGETAELRVLEGLVAQRFFSEVKKKKIDSSQFQVMLHDNHMPLDALDERGCNMLHYAAHRGHMNILPLVMGKNINKRDNYGMSPMLYAIKNNKIEAVSFLMEAGATIFTMNIYNEGMMHYAASNNQVEMMEKIMNIDSRSLTMRSNKGYLPIHKAARSGSLEAIEFLLKAGQDINAVTKNGDTALHIAAEEEHEKLFRYLINKGAATDVRNRAGRSSGEVPVFEDVEEVLTITPALSVSITDKEKSSLER